MNDLCRWHMTTPHVHMRKHETKASASSRTGLLLRSLPVTHIS